MLRIGIRIVIRGKNFLFLCSIFLQIIREIKMKLSYQLFCYNRIFFPFFPYFNGDLVPIWIRFFEVPVIPNLTQRKWEGFITQKDAILRPFTQFFPPFHLFSLNLHFNFFQAAIYLPPPIPIVFSLIYTPDWIRLQWNQSSDPQHRVWALDNFVRLH